MNLLTNLFDQHFHIHRHVGQLQRGRFGPQGVGFAVQFLNQKVQTFAQFAAARQQPVDFIKVGRQARDFFRHINTDGKRGGLCQCSVLRGFRQVVAAAKRHGFMPALHEARLLLRHQFGHHGNSRRSQCPQLAGALQQHLPQPGAFALARSEKFFQCLFGKFDQLIAVVVCGFVFTGCHAQDVGHTQRGGARQPGPDGVFHRAEALQSGCCRSSQAAATATFQRDAHFNFSALEFAAQQLAQCWLALPQLVGQAKGQVQKPAVDRTYFHPQPRMGVGAVVSF